MATTDAQTIGGMLDMLGSGGGELFPYLKFEKDGRTVVRFLMDATDGVGAMVHSVRVNNKFMGTYTCLGTTECPGCKQGDAPGYKGWIIVWDVAHKQVNLMGGGKRLFSAVQRCYMVMKDLRIRDVVIKQRGTGFDTRYSCYPAVKQAEFASMLASLGASGDEETQSPEDVLLSGRVQIPPGEVDVQTALAVGKALGLDGVTPATLFQACREHLVPTCRSMAERLPLARILTMYAGQAPQGDGGSRAPGTPVTAEDFA